MGRNRIIATCAAIAFMGGSAAGAALPVVAAAAPVAVHVVADSSTTAGTDMYHHA